MFKLRFDKHLSTSDYKVYAIEYNTNHVGTLTVFPEGPYMALNRPYLSDVTSCRMYDVHYALKCLNWCTLYDCTGNKVRG